MNRGCHRLATNFAYCRFQDPLTTLLSIPQVVATEKEWKYWCDTESPEEEDIPCGYHQNLDVFRKLLLIRSWCPDRTLSQVTNQNSYHRLVQMRY
jgi:hypothetical protein